MKNPYFEKDGNNESSANCIEICGEIKRETHGAILFFDGAITVWLPKSQIDSDEPNKYNQATVTMPEWLAKTKGLI